MGRARAARRAERAERCRRLEARGCCCVPPALWDRARGAESLRARKAGGVAAGALWAEQEPPVTMVPPPERGFSALSPRWSGRDAAAPRARGDPALRGLGSAERAGMLAGLSSLAAPCLAVAKKRRSLCAKKLPASGVCGFAALLCVTSS